MLDFFSKQAKNSEEDLFQFVKFRLINSYEVNQEVVLITAKSEPDFDLGKTLFLQYARSLSFSLCFQNFENELKQIHVQYNKPSGALILAYRDGKPIGCVGVRQFDRRVGELKRMFVVPEFRKLKIGQLLLEDAMNAAFELGYQTIRLDTLPEMVAAQSLYRQNGFYETSPNGKHPIVGTIYMEKVLTV